MARVLTRKKAEVPQIGFTVEVWKEGRAYVAYAPELDISTCGDSVAEARNRLREAAALFLEECSEQGTIDAVLSEAGFEKDGKSYRPPRVLARVKVRLAIPLAS